MRDSALRASHQLAEDWMFPIFLLVVIILVVVNRDTFFIRNLFRALFSRRYFKMEDRREGSTWVHASLLLAFFMVGGFIVSFVIQKFSSMGESKSKGEIFMISCLIVFVLFGLRWVVTSFIALAVGGNNQSLTDYNKFLSLSAKGAAIAGFVPMLCAAYFPQESAYYWILIGLGIFIFFALVSTIQGILGALQSGVPFFYIFFYLCTFEFLPVAVIGKILLYTVNNLNVIA
jgi:Domain of unknown function (DUF4271)